MRDFHQLLVWQKGHQLVLEVYRATAAFPAAEQYGLTSQLRRAAVSIPSNIAEGCGRQSDADLMRFLHIAFGSASEVEYPLLLAHDLVYLDVSAHCRLAQGVSEVKRMLAGLIKTLAGGLLKGAAERHADG